MFGNPSWTNPFDQPAGGQGGFGGVTSTATPTPAPQPGSNGLGGATQPGAPMGQPAPDAIWGHPNSLPAQPLDPEPSFQPVEVPRQGVAGDMPGSGLWGNPGSQGTQPNLYQRQFDFQGTQPEAASGAFQGFQGGPVAQAPAQARLEAFEPPRMGQMQQGNPYQSAFAQPSHPQMAQPVQAYGNQPANQAMPGNHMQQLPGNQMQQMPGNQLQQMPGNQMQQMPGNQMQQMPGNHMQQLPPQGNLYGQAAPMFQQHPPMPDGQLAGEASRLCPCQQPAVLLNVKKEGPNQGRPFFKCAKQHPEVPCGFFEWADEPPRAGAPAPGAAQNMPQHPPGPPCHCGEPTLSLTVKKDGPNQGRLFHKCGQNQCQFFQWADQEPDPLGPPCPCGVPSLRKTVSKGGPNNGRPFNVCARRSCNYFAWADEEAGGPTGPTPTPARAGGMPRSRDGDVCFQCNQPGHWAGSCPNKAGPPKGRGKGRGRGRGRKKAGVSEDDFGGFDDRFMPY